MKRKLGAVLLLALLAAVLFAVPSQAASDFVIQNGVLKSYTGSGGFVKIPSGVTSIGDSAFANCQSITDVDIPSSVTSIGECAFYCCDNLTSVGLQEGLKSIGDSAFYECTGLSNFIFPSTVTTIESYAFMGCSSLNDVYLPSSLTTLGTGAFAMSGAKDVTIPSGVKTISSGAFSYCSNLKYVKISAGVTTIGDYAFEDCDHLTSVTIPSTVTSIGEDAFSCCRALQSISLPDSVTHIGDSAFSSCNSATSLRLPSGLTSIGNWTFCWCNSLTSLSIPGSVKTIGNGAFYACSGLYSVTIPNGVTSIGDDAFFECTGLDYVIIPQNVTSIGEDAFEDCNDSTIYVEELSYAENHCLIHYSSRVEYATLAMQSVEFDSNPIVGQSVGITVKTNKLAKEILMYDTGADPIKTWTSGYTENGNVRTWKLSYTFDSAGEYELHFAANGAYGVDSFDYDVDVVVTQPAKINSAKFNSTATVGKPVGITVTTPTTAKYIAMCSSNGAAYKTWNSGYTDKNGVRTWNVTYTFSGSGNRTMYFKASADNSKWSALVSATVTVNKATEAAKVNSAKFDSSATVGKAVGITVTTNTSAKYIAMCSSNGAAYKTWTSGYTDSNGVRTWKVTYTFSGSGNRTMYFKASADNSTWSSLVSATVTVNKATEAAKVNSAKFDSSATVGKPVGITVTTNTSAKYIAMCSSNGSAYKTWTSGYTDSNGVRTWKVNYTFSGSGNRTMYFKASADNSNWSALVSATVTVNKAAAEAKVTSASFNNSAIVNQAVGITVKTTTTTKYVRMCSENGSTVRTWSSGYVDSGDVRTWNLSYSFSGAGYRSITFKGSANGQTFESGVVAKVAVNPLVPTVSSASFSKSSAKVNESVGITVKTSSNATTLALCSEGGGIVKTWSASGNSSVSGNVRTWSVSYSFGGAGNRSIGFKASANGSTYGSVVKANITITK